MVEMFSFTKNIAGSCRIRYLLSNWPVSERSHGWVADMHPWLLAPPARPEQRTITYLKRFVWKGRRIQSEPVETFDIGHRAHPELTFRVKHSIEVALET